MSESPGRPTFGHIYRQQYRQASPNKTSRAFQFITPVILVICAVIFRHSLIVAIVLAGLAVLLLAGVIMWSRRQRHDNTTLTRSSTK